MTARIVRAIEHPLVDVIGHLSGRKIEHRAPYELDVEQVIAAAARTGTMLEINASPNRRDVNDTTARAAAAAGVPIIVNCDAHRVGGFEVARYGIATARRAWLVGRNEPDGETLDGRRQPLLPQIHAADVVRRVVSSRGLPHTSLHDQLPAGAARERV